MTEELKQSISNTFKISTQYAKEVFTNSYHKEFPVGTHPNMIKAERALLEATTAFETVFMAYHSNAISVAETNYYLNSIELNIQRAKNTYKNYAIILKNERELSETEEGENHVSTFKPYAYQENFKTELVELNTEVEAFKVAIAEEETF